MLQLLICFYLFEGTTGRERIFPLLVYSSSSSSSQGWTRQKSGVRNFYLHFSCEWPGPKNRSRYLLPPRHASRKLVGKQRQVSVSIAGNGRLIVQALAPCAVLQQLLSKVGFLKQDKTLCFPFLLTKVISQKCEEFKKPIKKSVCVVLPLRKNLLPVFFFPLSAVLAFFLLQKYT